MTLFTASEFSDYNVRLATKEDVPIIIDMLISAASWLKNNGVDQWSYLQSGKENHEIEAAVMNETTYVVEDTNGNMVASFNLSSVQNSWDKELWGATVNSHLYLHRLVVAQTEHNKRIGSRLLEWMLDNIQLRKGSLRLDCVGHNQVLNRFYQNSGFEFIGSHDMGGDLFSKYERCIG
ncbi:GNAT family N-acetyltransferase [Virgibacillus flavescens]|uniref:GNAT family N-acetyltransferase n=1 Tax=Virgibacillus flavescens TaxID=1611422 RepID=UPI003D3414F9